VNTRGSFLGVKQLECETNHICLVLRLRISAAVLLLSPYAFLICTGTTLKLQNLIVYDRVLRNVFVSQGEQVRGGWRKLHSDERYDIYYLPDIIMVIR
jgi:hypothetical protein